MLSKIIKPFAKKMQKLLYLWNTRRRCVQTSQVLSRRAVNDPYHFLCWSVSCSKDVIYNKFQNGKSWQNWASTDSAWYKESIDNYDFLTNCSKVTSKRAIFVSHEALVALFQNLACTLRSWYLWSVLSFISIDQNLAETQPLNQFWVNILWQLLNKD